MAVTIDAVLEKLDGWQLDNPENKSINDYPEGIVYVVTEKKVESFIYSAQIQAAAYLNINDPDGLPKGKMTDESVETWAAGLLWNMKFDSEAHNAQEIKNETQGDKLIKQAQGILKPFNYEDDDDDGVDENHIFASASISF